jgi:hypothetical protein
VALFFLRDAYLRPGWSTGKQVQIPFRSGAWYWLGLRIILAIYSKPQTIPEYRREFSLMFTQEEVFRVILILHKIRAIKNIRKWYGT